MTENSERLRANYKMAFDQWARQVNRLQQVPEGSAASASPEAESSVKAAEMAYRQSRDRLIAEMVETANCD